jgi:hypothetical protein
MTLNDAGNVDPLFTTQFSEMLDILDKIASRNAPAVPPGRYDLRNQSSGTSGNSNASTIPMRVDRLVMSCDSACKITLNIGVMTFVFNLPSATTIDIPFPLKVNSGADCFVSASAGNLGACYFVYEPVR